MSVHNKQHESEASALGDRRARVDVERDYPGLVRLRKLLRGADSLFEPGAVAKGLDGYGAIADLWKL